LQSFFGVAAPTPLTEQAAFHSEVRQIRPPMLLQVSSTSMGVTLNQGILLLLLATVSLQAGVLSLVAPRGVSMLPQ
jgi:hypothetical protein